MEDQCDTKCASIVCDANQSAETKKRAAQTGERKFLHVRDIGGNVIHKLAVSTPSQGK